VYANIFSKFGLAFQNAVEELNLDNARQDMFDTSFIEVPEGDLQDFVEALQMGSAYN
jgi:hypothetical protein